jgi:glucose/arabinose dehydrogenase
MKKIALLVVFSLLLAVSGVQAQGVTPPDSSKYQWVKVVDGFQRPLFVTHAGDDRLFIVEQGGRISIFQNGQLLKEPFLNISSLVSRGGNEQGLLGLAFHPKYAQNGEFFIDYTDVKGDTMVARYHVLKDNPNVADPNSAKPVIQIDQPYANHNGGDVVFGPDGYLYIGMGDGGSAGDPQGNGQNPKALLGKILRLDVDNGDPYAAPKDNPSVANPELAPEVWAMGLRNPWRFSFDRKTGDLYIADVGQNQWEEVDFQPADSKGGENYGWNIMEGTHNYSGATIPEGLVMPFAEYSHAEGGCSITGGYVYRGKALPDLNGIYFFADYCSGKIWSSYRDDTGKWQTNLFMQTNYVISSFGEDAAGELYLLDHGNGAVYRLEAK